MAFIISHKYKFVYIHIPKTGGTSLAGSSMSNRPRGGYLADILPETDIMEPHRNIFRASKYLKKYFFWTTLRYPFDRFVSGYIRECNLYGECKFTDFVTRCTVGKVHKELIHVWFPQTSWITYFDGTIPMDAIVDFKELVPQTLEVLKKLGVPTDKPFPHLKKSDRKPWQEYYSERDKDRIYNFYKKDFDLYDKISHSESPERGLQGTV